ncbi:Suppressor of SWI4-like protein [Zancudomyces culisetae]|uniref:Suppressor of SWI4-like protein n=1 Tax=Zancudomyces culisetae TaxID=1213189 RepID=A0A1R1PKL1_ZANCU|nr:Suppressor of SWI4-like protein [Zancudomyces culisetae]|eukprot:OMH81422.1 Suppressor of SWI4-like protein [Zancudomyces culisetae]
MVKKRKGKKSKHNNKAESAEKVPKSFVVAFGKVGTAVSQLVRDVRLVMEPNTASRLKERKTNKLRDYLAVAGPLGVSHMMMFTQTKAGTNLRVGCFPRGPTLTFKVSEYSLSKDVKAIQKNPRSIGSEFKTAPILILNSFGSGEGKGKQFQLMSTVFQNMFPTIDPTSVRLADMRRVVLLSYNDEKNKLEFRHYLITVKAVGVSKGLKRLIDDETITSDAKFRESIEKLKSLDDIGEFVLQDGSYSDSEVEDMGGGGFDSKVTLAQDYVGKRNRKSEQRSVKLIEIGPRMELDLTKVESGLCEGDILYHRYIHKTPEEVKEIMDNREKRLTEKARRKQEQEANVERKKALKDAKKKKTDTSNTTATKSQENNGDESGSDDNDGEYDDDNSHALETLSNQQLLAKLDESDSGNESYDEEPSKRPKKKSRN